MIKYRWKVIYQSNLGRSIIRNLKIDASRNGRTSSCETPMRAFGDFELSAKKNVPTDVALPQNSPIYVYYGSLNGIVGDSTRVFNGDYEKIIKSSKNFLTKTDHVPIRVFALSFSSKIPDGYLSQHTRQAIVRSAWRYINLSNNFDFVTLPLFYGYNEGIMREIISIGYEIKKDSDTPIAAFIDMRNENTFSVFKKIIEDNQIYSNFDLILIKWANPDRHLADYYFIEDLLIKSYHAENLEDFPPMVMVATQRKSDNTTNLSGVHYTHIFGGDLHNVFRSQGRFGNSNGSILNPPLFFYRETLTINTVSNTHIFENHPLINRHSLLKKILNNPNEWTSSPKHRTSANGLAYMLETYDSTDEFKLEQKYIKNDELQNYYAEKIVLKNKTKTAINIKALM